MIVGHSVACERACIMRFIQSCRCLYIIQFIPDALPILYCSSGPCSDCAWSRNACLQSQVMVLVMVMVMLMVMVMVIEFGAATTTIYKVLDA